MLKLLWLAAFLSLSAQAARPYYATEAALSTKLETQSELVASTSTFSLPPLLSKWGAAVLDAMSAGDVSRAADVAANIPGGTIATPTVGTAALADGLRIALQPGQTAFESINSGVAGEVVEASRASRASLDMLLLSLEATGEGKSLFMNIAVKGAIAKWNAVVGEALARWQVLAQQRGSGNQTEIRAIEKFLGSPHSERVQNVLAAFAIR
jgi:hypothetical protein